MQLTRTGPELNPAPRRWTKLEYYEMAELGWFRGQRVELLDGEIMVLSPQNWPHAASTDQVAEVLRRVFGTGYWVRMQLPLDLGLYSEPEPDVSVVLGSRNDYQAHPTTAVLLVEISDTTLSSDRHRKGSLYARAGVSDYWIVNLVDLQVEVYRDPVPDNSQPHGFRCATREIKVAGETLSPLALPHAQVAVADLLPAGQP